jgi:hypothetical protein
VKRREIIARVEAVVDEAKRVVIDDVDGRVAEGLVSSETVMVMRMHLAQLDIALGRAPFVLRCEECGGIVTGYEEVPGKTVPLRSGSFTHPPTRGALVPCGHLAGARTL